MYDDVSPHPVRISYDHGPESLLQNTQNINSNPRPLPPALLAPRHRSKSSQAFERVYRTAPRAQTANVGQSSPERRRLDYRPSLMRACESASGDSRTTARRNESPAYSSLEGQDIAPHDDKRSGGALRVSQDLEKAGSIYSNDQGHSPHSRPLTHHTTIYYEGEDPSAEEHSAWILVRMIPSSLARTAF